MRRADCDDCTRWIVALVLARYASVSTPHGPRRRICGDRVNIIRRNVQGVVTINISRSAIALSFATDRPHILADNGFYDPCLSVTVPIILKPHSVPNLQKHWREGKVHLPIGLTITQSHCRIIGMV